ncbi:ribose 5-phosphate isomerase B [Cryomorphaceae bacterium]|nr:ribose 5-phosphate isomerase B [Cryomorphaceae bacterium]
MKIGIAGDHAAYELKPQLTELLESLGHEVENFGTDGPDSVDYPDHAHPLATSIEEGRNELGIAICGSGNGINMTLNKHEGIRSALCWNEELADLARQHNDANVVALPARFITDEMAKRIVQRFLTAEFEGGRHQRRVDKIACA